MQALKLSIRLLNFSVVNVLPIEAIQHTSLYRISAVKKYSSKSSDVIASESSKNDALIEEPIKSTTNLPNLMEFFDNAKNWGQEKVKSGRSWTKDELRIKSNSDLHKLWYVLLKEKNMLLTMEHAAKSEKELMASPERRDKVEESMENLEEVIKERNRAYHLLETGETGERQIKIVRDGLGLFRRYAEIEHIIPIWMNSSFRKKYYFNGRGNAVNKFIALLKEKHWNQKQYKLRGQRRHVKGLLTRFPEIEDELLEEKFPDINIKKIRQSLS